MCFFRGRYLDHALDTGEDTDVEVSAPQFQLLGRRRVDDRDQRGPEPPNLPLQQIDIIPGRERNYPKPVREFLDHPFPSRMG